MAWGILNPTSFGFKLQEREGEHSWVDANYKRWLQLPNFLRSRN
jgi:hypothetical protein